MHDGASLLALSCAAQAQQSDRKVTSASAPRLPAFSTDNLIQLSDAAQAQPRQCHIPDIGQEAPDWCAKAGVQGGHEYKFFEGGVTGPCMPCWCCKREVEVVPFTSLTTSTSPRAAPWLEASMTTTAAITPAADNHAKYHIQMDGISEATILAGSVGNANGDALTLHHNSGFSLFSKYEASWEPENVLQLKLRGKTMSSTVRGDPHVLVLFEEMQKSNVRITEGLCAALLARCAEAMFFALCTAASPLWDVVPCKLFLAACVS